MRWYQLLIDGREDDLKALLAAHPGEAILGSDLRLADESLADRVLEFIHARTSHLVFASEEHARRLVRAIGGTPDLRLDGTWEVVEGRFGFKAEAYSPEVGDRIHEALSSDLPAGIECLDLEKEVVDPDAKGIELFTPVHEYVYKARGTVVGHPPGILEMNRRLHRLDFVHEEPLELSLREVSPDALG